MNKLHLLLLPLIWLVGTTAEAQVPDAYYNVVASAGNASIGGEGATPRNAAVDRPVHVYYPGDGSDVPFGWDLDQHAHAEAFGGTNPQAVATAAASATSPFGAAPTAIANAYATVIYFLHLQTTNATGLVWQPAQIPVLFHALGEASGSANAEVRLTNLSTGASLFYDRATGLKLPNPSPGFDRTLDFSVAPTDYLRVNLYANAGAYDDTDFSTTDAIFSQAIADPTFDFDQVAFDQYAASLGQQTFNLGDFYAFEFSPTVVPNVVPEPASGLLLLFGAAFCLRRSTLRTHERGA